MLFQFQFHFRFCVVRTHQQKKKPKYMTEYVEKSEQSIYSHTNGRPSVLNSFCGSSKETPHNAGNIIDQGQWMNTQNSSFARYSLSLSPTFSVYLFPCCKLIFGIFWMTSKQAKRQNDKNEYKSVNENEWWTKKQNRKVFVLFRGEKKHFFFKLKKKCSFFNSPLITLVIREITKQQHTYIPHE